MGRSMTTSSGPFEIDARADVLASIADRLGSVQEARWILDHAGIESAHALVERRESGEPLQYVLGQWSFRSVEVRVDPRVLIPRPETEQVVEVALRELERLGRVGAFEEGSGPVCVDLGTGSGAIALSLAVEAGALLPGLEVWATDRSPDALEVAAENVADLAIEDPVAADRVRLVEGSWFGALPRELRGRITLVVSNPPYVAEAEYEQLDPSVRDWEPAEALIAAPGREGPGMAAIEAVVEEAPAWLATPGAVVIEIDPRQAAGAAEVARRAGFADVAVERDLAGRLRALVARR